MFAESLYRTDAPAVHVTVHSQLQDKEIHLVVRALEWGWMQAGDSIESQQGIGNYW